MSRSPAPPEGLARCARYALPTTERRFCGPEVAPEALRTLLTTGRGVEAARRSLRRFEALHPYLEFLAEEADRDPFDAEVVEAYWLGNDLLERDWRGAYPRLLERLVGRGLVPSFAAALRESLPSDPVPCHTFHVLFVGVGAVTGHVPTTLPNMESCRISWGRVEEVGADGLTVQGPTLAWTNEAFGLEESTRSVSSDEDLLPEIHEGDVVSIHWETAIEVLSARTLSKLRHATLRAVKAANEAAASVEGRLGAPGA